VKTIFISSMRRCVQFSTNNADVLAYLLAKKKELLNSLPGYHVTLRSRKVDAEVTLRIDASALRSVSSDAKSTYINCSPPTARSQEYMNHEIRELLLWAFARVNETSENFILHSSAVQLGKHVVLFIGDSGAGKTSMATAMVLNKGACLLSDNTTVVRAQAGTPRIVDGTLKPSLSNVVLHACFPDLVINRKDKSENLDIEGPLKCRSAQEILTKAPRIDYAFFLRLYPFAYPAVYCEQHNAVRSRKKTYSILASYPGDSVFLASLGGILAVQPTEDVLAARRTFVEQWSNSVKTYTLAGNLEFAAKKVCSLVVPENQDVDLRVMCRSAALSRSSAKDS